MRLISEMKLMASNEKLRFKERETDNEKGNLKFGGIVLQLNK